MAIKDSVEFLYLMLMFKWERTAPDDNRQGVLDGKIERNTQMSRLAFVLNKIAAGNVDDTFRTLAVHTRRNDGRSYVSNDPSWMIRPYALSGGWYFEGTTNIGQKQNILQALRKLGLSPTFVSCADDFVECKNIEKYMPNEAEQGEILRKSREKEAMNLN